MAAVHQSYDAAHAHPIPTLLTGFRVLELIISTSLLGLSSYGVHVGSTSGFDLTLFTSICSMLSVIYVFIASRRTIWYNYWGIITLDVFLVIFWLISFAKTASEANTFRKEHDYFHIYLYGINYTYRSAMIACAVLGAFNFTLYVCDMFAMSHYFKKHRDAGGRSHPNPQAALVEMQRSSDIGPPTVVRNGSVSHRAPVTMSEAV